MAKSIPRPIVILGFIMFTVITWQTLFLGEPSHSIHDLDLKETEDNTSGFLVATGSHSMSKISTYLSTSSEVRKPRVPIMSKMGNETLKAELGRSAWRLLHTMAGKFPETPTKAQRQSLLDFIYLFAELYPCGECAAHFKIILEANPPDVSSRQGVSQWACKVHNLVNERLKKPQFDCATVGDFWKCGCAEDEKENNSGTSKSSKSK